MKLMILPDNATKLPVILGRDFLLKFKVVLSQTKLVYTKKKLLQIKELMATKTNKRMYSCVLVSEVLNKCKRFDLTKPFKPVHIQNVPHCGLPNDVLVLNNIVTDVPDIFAIDFSIDEPTFTGLF